MRVALVTDEPYFSGIGKYSSNLFSGLRRFGVDTDLYFLQWSNRQRFARETVGVPIKPLPFSLPVRTLENFMAQAFRDRILPKKYDIYHATQQFLISSLPSYGVRVATVHDLKPLVMPESYPPLLRFVLRMILRRAAGLDLILVDSLNTKSDLCRLFDVPEKKVKVIPLGVSDVFTPKHRSRETLQLPSDLKILIHVGTEDRSKNIPFLLKVLSTLSMRLSNLILIRVGEKSRQAEKLIRKWSLQDKVIYVKGLSEEKLAYYYSAADLLLFPSFYEGFGLPPLESMASGCPVMCSDKSSLPEVVGLAGIVIPLNVEEWVEQAYSILTRVESWQHYRELGLDRAKQFSWSECAKTTAKAYLDVAK